MASLVRSYHNFRFLVRSVRWVELAISATIVVFAHVFAGLAFDLTPLVFVFALGLVWNWGFWYAGRRHLLRERGPEGTRLLVWSWVIADVVTNLLVITFTGVTASPFLFFLAFPVILSTVALGRARSSYAIAVGSVVGLAAIWGMLQAGSIPHFRAYPGDTDLVFLENGTALSIFLVLAAGLCALVYTIFRFRPNFFGFQESIRDGRFQLSGFRGRNLRELSLEDVEAVGPEDLLEEAVQGLTLSDRVAFGAAIVLPAGADTLGGTPGDAWHRGLTLQRVVSTTRRQVIPTWNEFDAEHSGLFESLRSAEPGDLFEGPFEVLRKDGLFPHFDDADSYLATVVGQNGRPVVVLVAGLRHPIEDRAGVVLHVLNIAAQLRPLLVAESRLSQMRGELTSLHNENEALSRANKLQSDFVSIASHELKTPLTAIGAYADALLMNADNPDFPERREFLEVIRHENDRLLRMVNRILDFSQIEFGNRALNRRTVQLRELLAESVKTMQPQLERKQQEIQQAIPESLPSVEADRDLMMQVFLNLIGNASKFSPEGSTIRVGASEEATQLVVTVSDEGPGIPAHEIPHIFKQFYRVRRDKSDTAEGSGLGLTIVSNILDMHGGRIEVVPGDGPGTTFRFQLPKQQCVNDERRTVLGDVTRRAEFQHLMRLLVKMLADYMNCKIVSVMLLSQDQRELYIQVAYGLDEQVVQDARVELGSGIAGRVAASGKPLLIEDLQDESGYARGNQAQYETRSLVSVPMLLEGEVLGVINCNNKVSGEPFYPDDLALLVTLTDKVVHALGRALRYENVRDELERTVDALEAMVRLQHEGVGTSRRAARLAMDLGRRMGLSRRQVLALQYACMIHDVGMTAIDTSIVRKAGPLTDQEKELVRSHPGRGVTLIEPFLSADDLDEIIRYHHERVDGTGYPAGLRGEHIPLAARILAVIDAYDSMTSDRAWRKALRPSEAATELLDNSGTQFDVEVVQSFLDVLAENAELDRDEYQRLKDGQPWLHPASS
jgi:signal transduction histidine kinase/HD-GYP domain-containing protein (c-di-GMP phosphodiesterase class II)